MSTTVLRALAGKPGAAKRALQEQYGVSASADLGDGAPTHIVMSLQACCTPFWRLAVRKEAECKFMHVCHFVLHCQALD